MLLVFDFVLILLFYVIVGVFGEMDFCVEIGSKSGFYARGRKLLRGTSISKGTL